MNAEHRTERTITMTVYAIEARLLDMTQLGDPSPDYRFGLAGIKVKARGQGEEHEWWLRDGQRCWPGDRIQVTVIEEHGEPHASTDLTPPPIDKR